MKKIATIVSYKYLPAESGGQKYIATFLKYLGEQTDLVVFGTKNNSDKKGKYTLEKCFSNNPLSYIDIVGLIKTYRHLKRNKINTLIIEHPYIGWMGILLRELLDLKIIIHTHNIEYQRFKSIGKWWWPILKFYEKWILRQANHILCITEEDRDWMINSMNLDESMISICPYGIENSDVPNDKKEAKEKICKKHFIEPSKQLIFFNGLLSYKPNQDGIESIIQNILPQLDKTDFKYHLIIAGKGLSKELTDALSAFKNVTYVGFIERIEEYTKAADIFINPILSGGGVKTKLIEALAMNCYCISTQIGAIGVNKNICSNKLKITETNNWNHFIQLILNYSQNKTAIQNDFYKYYNWSNIIMRTINHL